MIIAHNMVAMNAHRNMSSNVGKSGKASEKLGSGLRISKAADDAAGLSISEKMRAQIRGLDQAERNAQDGISMIQTTEGALGEVHSIMQRMRELAVQAANDTNVTGDRSAISLEVEQLGMQMLNIQKTTQFNEQNVFTGKAGNSGIVNIQVGANKSESMMLDFTQDGINLDLAVDALYTSPFGGGGNPVKTHADAENFIQTIDGQIKSVSEGRSILGAYQNRLEHSINSLSNSSENIQASESRIRDVDMAKEIMEFSKSNILTQAAQAMIAQGNQMPQSVLQLLKNQ